AGLHAYRRLLREEEEERDQQGEDAQSFGNGEAEDQAAELAIGGGRVAQGAGEVVAEDMAEADTGAAHAETGDTGADCLSCFYFHFRTPCGSTISDFRM